MKTYKKYYSDLNCKEKESFLQLSESDAYMQKILDNIEEDRSLNVEVAFARRSDNAVVAVDYSVYDPYKNYTPAGYNDWGFENYDEDEEVESEDDLPLYWEGMTYEEKVCQLKWIDETYHFASDYSDASDAAAAVRTGYLADPNWFGFEVDDAGAWEAELAELLEPYFAKDIELSALDEVKVFAYCVTEGMTAPCSVIILDTDYCIGDDGCKYQLCDKEDAHRVMDESNIGVIICKVSDDHYTITDVYGNEREFDGLYINYAEDGAYKALEISGVEVYEALKNYKNDTVPCRKLEWVDCHRADEQGGIAGLTMVAGDKYDGDYFGEKLFILMYERLYSTELPDLREDINRVDELEKIAILLEYEYTCWLNGEADVYFYVKE